MDWITMIRTELYTQEMPELFNRFSDVIDDKSWLKRYKNISAQIRGNKFLKEYLLQENEIVFTLAHLSKKYNKYNGLPLAVIEDHNIYPAMRFVAQSLSIIDALEGFQERDQFIGRIRGSMNNPDEMRDIRHEIAVATHFVLRGYEVTWPELLNEELTCDLLVSGIGSNNLEIECKHISENKGIKITNLQALKLYQSFHEMIQPVVDNMSSGLLVVLTLPGRLPTEQQKLKELSGRVIMQIHIGSGAKFDDGVKISIADFNVGELDGLNKQMQYREITDRVSSTYNRETLILRNSNSGALLFVVKSEKDDDKLNSIFKLLRGSAERQFSHTRPALFMVGLSGISCDDLEDMAKKDADSSNFPTDLRLSVSKFLVGRLAMRTSVTIGFGQKRT